MRRLKLTLGIPEELRHPMQHHLEREETADRHRLLFANAFGEETLQLLFQVEGGDPALQSAAMDEIEAVHSYDIAPIDESTFYVLVEEDRPAVIEYFEDLLRTIGVIPIPPVDILPGGTVTVTLVGDHEELRTLVQSLPDSLTVDIERLDAYERPMSIGHGSLTSRQREAVVAAKDVGYYAVPREGGVTDVADRLGCAPSTASNHLRKAEVAVMGQIT